MSRFSWAVSASFAAHLGAILLLNGGEPPRKESPPPSASMASLSSPIDAILVSESKILAVPAGSPSDFSVAFEPRPPKKNKSMSASLALGAQGSPRKTQSVSWSEMLADQEKGLTDRTVFSACGVEKA